MTIPPDARANPLAGNPLRCRADLQQAVRDLVLPLVPHFSPGRARVRLGSFAAHFPQADAELEGFARPLWGLAPLAAGGGRFEHWSLWQQGLATGSDPDHPERWNRYESIAQTMVEQAAIGVALALVPEVVWDPLPAEARRNLSRWLSLVNRHEPVPNNWQFFRVLVNLGLERVGEPTDEAALERSFDRIESYYEADGWYRDGVLGAHDHYIGWAFHAYGLVYAKLRPNDPRSDVFRARARRFAGDFEAWFDARGRVVPFGRSLTYRFAAAAFFSALAFANEEALPWGRLKGLVLRHLRWWSRQPISDRDGVLSLGWSYANPWMRESYNSAGSPYWSMKAFLCLAVPEDHPFWQQPEEPLAPRRHVPQPVAGVLASRDETQTVLLNGAHSALARFDQGPSKYGRLAYSSAFGFCIETESWGRAMAGDSALVIARRGGPLRLRREVTRSELDGDLLYSRWAPFEGVLVHTVLAADTPWHLRLHRIEAELEIDTEESGFALGLAEPGEALLEKTAGFARCRSIHGVSWIRGVAGGEAAREGDVTPLPPNANLMHPHAAVPVLRTPLGPGVHELGCSVFGSDREDHPAAGGGGAPDEAGVFARMRALLEREAARSA